MSTKVIFLDIDGVLNNAFSESRSPSGCKGIDDDKLQRLQQIVACTGAKIVLTSTWKTDWYPNEYDDLPADGRYMIDRLKEYGLHILNKTEEATWFDRGKGILKWLYQHPNVEYFCILDDECFDYLDCGLSKYHVKTVFRHVNGGLQDKHVNKAIDILMNKENRWLQ